VGTASYWGQVLGYPAWGPDGGSGGIRSDVVMLWQQGAMREVLTWESEVEGAMREMEGGWQRRSLTYN